MPPKSKKRGRKPKEVVDTEQYHIEKISDSDIQGNTISYKIRWMGYSPDYDTLEAEWRMNCDEKLIDFCKTHIVAADYTHKIQKFLDQLDNVHMEKDMILKILDPLSILGQTTVQCGSVKFVDVDTIRSKILFLEYIRDTNQNHLLHSALIPSEDTLDRDADRYTKELRHRLTVFPDHPFVKITFPLTTPTSVFYAPPPISALLFEPITMEMFEKTRKLKHLIVPPSMDPGFNESLVFMDSESMKTSSVDQDPRFFHLFVQNKGKRAYEGMPRTPREPRDGRFTVALKLIQEPGSGWILLADSDCDVDTPLLSMSGVISPAEMAHQSLVRQGERVAFSSFVHIPGTEMCLDRRLFHDFSRYIPHSCNPTCSVRLVASGNEYPDLVVYNLVKLNKRNGRVITLDWYEGFTRDVIKYFNLNKHPDGKLFCLYEKKMDFVQCVCDVPACREVLYVDRSLIAEDQEARKDEKLAKFPPRFRFRGLQIAETKKIWEISEGMFME
ncbi:unnamed protein product [Caenorhabditis brenneri]